VKIAELCLRRPLIAAALGALLFIGGLAAIVRLPIGLYPRVESGTISVRSIYPGASAELMDGRVTSQVLSALSGVEDVDYVTSSSQPGSSEVTLHLDAGSDPQKVLVQTMERIRALSGLPADMDPPQVDRPPPEGLPDMAFAFSSRRLSGAQIVDYLERVVKPRLESIKGVGRVETLGPESAMRIWLQPRRMERFGVTAIDVAQALKMGNVLPSAGTVRGRDRKVQLVAQTGMSTAEDFAALPIGGASAALRLGDVARIELGGREPEVASVFDGRPAALAVLHWHRGNPLRAGEAVRRAVDELRAGFPQDLQAHVLVDGAGYIAGAVGEVLATIVLTALAVTVAIALGAGGLRPVLVPVMAIPISLVGACLLLGLLGFSLNVLTLLALVLATGLVVDDAIVVLDSTLSGLAGGQQPSAAALGAVRRIGASLVTMTVTLAVAYLPLVFIGGFAGSLFIEFAVTLAGAVLLSGLLAVTLTPVMCARILSSPHRQLFQAEAVFARARRAYARALVRVLRTGMLPPFIWGACLVGGAALLWSLPHDLAPKEDQGNLMVLASAPISATAGLLSQQIGKLESAYKRVPEIVNYNYVQGVPRENTLLSFARLSSWSERGRSAMALQRELQERLDGIAALQSVVVLPSSLPGSGMLPFQFVLKHEDGDYRALAALSDALLARLRRGGMFLFLNQDLKYDAPQLGMRPDREQLARAGVSAADVGYTLGLACANIRTQSFVRHGRSHDVVLGLDPADGATMQDLLGLRVRGEGGRAVRLGSLLGGTRGAVPESLNTFQHQASATLQGVPAPGVALSAAAEYARSALAELRPRGVSADLGGETRQSEDEHQRQALALGLALLGIYALLGLQFNNCLDPLLVLLGSVPLALLGALLGLKLRGVPLDLYTQIGLLTLVGLISKQGILMVQAANDLRARGVRSAHLAIIRACASRLRAIVLTSVTMVLGALPLLLASGPAAVSRAELGLVIVSGMVVGPVLVLFLLPSLYVYAHSGRRRARAWTW
jgi:multidrug efflux pump